VDAADVFGADRDWRRVRRAPETAAAHDLAAGVSRHAPRPGAAILASRGSMR